MGKGLGNPANDERSQEGNTIETEMETEMVSVDGMYITSLLLFCFKTVLSDLPTALLHPLAAAVQCVYSLPHIPSHPTHYPALSYPYWITKGTTIQSNEDSYHTLSHHTFSHHSLHCTVVPKGPPFSPTKTHITPSHPILHHPIRI